MKKKHVNSMFLKNEYSQELLLNKPVVPQLTCRWRCGASAACIAIAEEEEFHNFFARLASAPALVVVIEPDAPG